MEAIVSVNWLNEHLEDDDLIILDASLSKNQASLSSHYVNKKIKGARKFDLETTFSDLENPLPKALPSVVNFEAACRALGVCKNSKIVIYDNLGLYSSPRAWWMFKIMGHEQVAVLDGGLPAWIANKGWGEPVDLSMTVEQGDFKANYNAEKVKNLVAIQKNLETSTFLLIDARSEVRFYGKTPESRPNLRSGHIPNAINIPFTEVLNDGYLKKIPALKQLFASKLKNEKNLVFSCGSGVTACIVLWAASIVLDNRVTLAVYDGSWAEWGSRADLPISLY